MSKDDHDEPLTEAELDRRADMAVRRAHQMFRDTVPLALMKLAELARSPDPGVRGHAERTLRRNGLQVRGDGTVVRVAGAR